MTRTKAIEQSQGKSSEIIEIKRTEDTETSAKQSQTETCKQLTLLVLHRSTKSDLEAMQDEIGILVHGTSYLDPRISRSIIEEPWKSMVKVNQSAAGSKQYRTERNEPADQQCSRGGTLDT